MKKLLIIGALLLPLALASCRTEMPEMPWTEHDVSGIQIKVRPASRDSLIAKYGNPTAVMNPLVDYPSLLQQRKLFVLDVEFSAPPEMEIELITRETTLVYTSEDMKLQPLFDPETRALDAKHLQDAWTVYLENHEHYKIPEMMNKTYNALPGNLVARPGEPAKGYLVFLRRFPESGTAELSLAFKASNGDTGAIPLTIEIPDMTDKDKNAEIQENTGIFDETEQDGE